MRRDDEKKKRAGAPTASLAKGVLFGYGVILALFAGAAGLIVSGNLPEAMMGHVAVFAAFAGAFSGTVFAVKLIRRRPFIYGAALGAVMFFVTFFGAAFSASGRLFSGLTPVFFFAFLAGGAGGGLVMASGKRRKRA
ncbi:MAG: TIGR04086 family membrane protein [Oscillospiraceae bacterium]|jgi:putative membrane protein (TIGR04086 family)|nr:TIGR04086 family membrane protein [Oscillospiraceae bacterium]